MAWFCVIVFVAFSGASAGDGAANAANTGDIVTCNGGRGTVRVVMFTGSTITIDLCTNVFSSPASATFIDLLLFWW